ncbi:MAG: hypothetical protein OEO77_02215 [Acidimicrobiia bacterium]|nr:hypothetical protein [Acidimicrobiia bacterium]
MSRDEAWKTVSDRFGTLGKSFKKHYEETEEAPSTDEVKKAMDTVGDGLERLFSSLGGAIRDDAVKAQAKDAASSVVDALSATFSELGVELKRAAEKVKKTDEPAPSDAMDEVVEAAGDPVEVGEDIVEDAEDALGDLREDLTDS